MQAAEQLQEIRALARDFAEAELRPHVERWDHERAIDASTIGQLGELGFFGMLVPETHGGMDFDLPTFAAAIEELARGEAAIAMMVAGNAVLSRLLVEHGTEAQRQQWLDRIIRGDVIATVAAAEEEAGSDVGAIQTTAMRSGAGWVLTGEKKWVSNAGLGGLALVLARTSENSQGAFLVPLNASGVLVTDRAETLGFRTIDISTVRFDGVQLGGDAVLGEPDAGAAMLTARAPLARIAAAAVATGIARAALEYAITYADTREQFGTRLRAFEGIQFKLADMSARTAAARALLESAAAAPARERIAQAKLFAGEAAMWVTTQAVQVFGGNGYMRDYPVEKLMRDAKAMELIEGASELLRVEIAETFYAHE